MQTNGRLVLVGSSGGDATVTRLNRNGTFDTSFAEDGTVKTDFGGTESAQAVVVQPDGKIVIVGQTDAPGPSVDLLVARYTLDGSLDNSFSGDGWTTLDLGGSDVGQAAVIQSSGKIVVAGNRAPGAMFLARYNANGSLDTTFGGSNTGWLVTNLGADAIALDLALQSDNKLVVSGKLSGDLLVARFDADGLLDTSFAGGVGWATADLGAVDNGQSIAIQPVDGKIVVAGPSDDRQFVLARFTSNGSVDNSCDGDGKLTLKPGADGQGTSVAIQNNGKIVFAGSTDTGNIAVMRFNGADCSLDSSFGSGGIAIVDLGPDEFAEDMLVQPDGKIVVSGVANPSPVRDQFLARLMGETFVGPSSFTVDAPAGAPDAPDLTPYDAVCKTAANTCTLRAALEQVATLSSVATVNVPAGTHALTQKQIKIDPYAASLAIEGAVDGSNVPTAIVEGLPNPSEKDRIFYVVSGATVQMRKLVIRKGSASTFERVPGPGDDPGYNGGGILNLGNLTLDNLIVTLNATPGPPAGGGGGGGLANWGLNAVLTVSNSTISLNTTATNSGGGIQNLGTLNVNDSIITGNESYNGGGGISTVGSLGVPTTTITNSTISNNKTFLGSSNGNSGGGITDQGNLTLTNVTISGNRSEDGASGGLLHSRFTPGGTPGTASLTNVTISGNYAKTSNGGAAFNSGLTATLTNVTISGNIADGAPENPMIPQDADGKAGGLRIGGSAISGTSATLVNVTISGNTAQTVNGRGGGLRVSNPNSTDPQQKSSATLINVTIANNSAATGGGISIGNGSATLKNTLISSGVAGANCDGIVISQNGNLSNDGTCGFTQVADLKLGPLADNGGPTKTHALLNGSPAIDGVIAPATCLNIANAPLQTDQRNLARPFDGNGDGQLACDIGAFELQTVHPVDVSLAITDAPDPIGMGQPLTYTLTVTNISSTLVPGVTVSDTLPSGVTFGSATPSQGTCSGTSVVTCNLGSLSGGASRTVTLVVTPTQSGTLTNTASIVGQPSDPTPANNSATTTTTVQGNCDPRPNVQVTTAKGSTGQLIATIKAQTTVGTPTNGLSSIRFTRIDNASVQLNGSPATVGPAIPLSGSPQQATVLVTRQAPTQNPALASTVFFEVIDTCGVPWKSFVGGGPGAF